MAHYLAKLIYRGLTYGQTYLEAGLAALGTQTQNSALQSLKRRAAHLGWQVVPVEKTA